MLIIAYLITYQLDLLIINKDRDTDSLFYCMKKKMVSSSVFQCWLIKLEQPNEPPTR